jgi:hypothetical protein
VVEPSPAARELVRGAYDLHVHIAPDVVPRRIDDVALARRFAEVGLAGFTLKSHYVPTQERAAVVDGLVDGVRVFGSIALNRSVGGMNPVAVEIAAREGALIVWMPTVDSVNEASRRTPPRPGENLPVWAAVQRELDARGLAPEPVAVVDASGRVLPETRAVLAAIAAHDVVLATGHLARAEILAVVEAALEEGVRKIVVTHPEFPTQAVPLDEQRDLAARGALLERCLTTPHTGKVDWETWLERTRGVGAGSCLLSSDLGQPENPPVEDGLALLADRLLAAGFSEDDVRTMAVDNSRRLVA